MYILRLLFSGGYLRNNVACSIGRRIGSFQIHSYCSSAELAEERSKIRPGGNLKVSGQKRCLVLRVYLDAKGKPELTERGKKIDKQNQGILKRYVNQLTKDFEMGDAFVVSKVVEGKSTYEAAVLSCCGPKDAKVNEREALDEKKENVRCCLARGWKLVKSMSMNHDIVYEIADDDELTILEGYLLAYWTITKEFTPVIWLGSNIGTINGQHWARYLSQMPPDKMTPEGVVKEAKKELGPLKVKVTDYDKKDIEAKNMHAFLAVAQGSSAPPKLLECEFVGKANAPLVLIVAKGVTFDSGGLCLKKPENLLKHDGMTGAAAALGTMYALATLKAPVNVKLVVPLCENMISGQCLKVGDVVPTLKGLDVKVEDTNLEGHLMLADALTYGQAQYKPKYVLDIAALTSIRYFGRHSVGRNGTFISQNLLAFLQKKTTAEKKRRKKLDTDIAMATGGVCYGCFTHNDDLWKIAREVGIKTGDRPWRFPIWDSYGKLITGDTPVYNLKKRGPGMASHCTAAAFLDKFVTDGDNWLHYDITGVGKMTPDTAPIYLDPNYMTGRPTRALIETILKLSKPKHDDDGTCPLTQATTERNHDKRL